MTETLRVLCAGGFRAAMDRLLTEWAGKHGPALSLTFATPTQTRDHLENGFPFDAGIVVASVLKAVQAKGLARGAHDFRLAISPVGLGVPQGSTIPEVTTLAAFRLSLESFATIGLSDPAAGTNLGVETLALADLAGVGEALRARSRFFAGPGSFVSAAVARGEADAVITLASEIVPITGVRFAGRLPPELQTEYAMQAFVPLAAPASVGWLMEVLRAPIAKAIVRQVGLSPAA